MTEEQLLLLVGDPEKLKEELQKERPAIDIESLMKQYDPSKHVINDRSAKLIETEQGPSSVPVIKLPVPLQKTIVGHSVAFLCGNPIKLDAVITGAGLQEDLLSVINKTLEDNKIFYKNMNLAEILFSETEVAELWYSEPLASDDEYWEETPNKGVRVKLRMKVLANSLGDKLYPSFNEYGDMIAFGRYFTTGKDSTKTEHLDVYTANTIYNYSKLEGGAWVILTSGNPAGKIPVSYYSIPQPDYKDVQPEIERIEESYSKHGDTNEYYGSPMVKITGGEVKGFSKKGESGKIIELDAGVDAEYMTWDNSPESVKLEQTNLRSLIYDLTSTPDISFTQMSKLGTFSGFAIKLLFTAAHMKAAKNEQVFGEGVQRRVNYIKAAMVKLNPRLEKAKNLSIKPVFEYFLPKNTAEELDLIVTAVTSGIMSIETAVSLNPLIADKVEELKRLLKEKKERDADPAGLDDLNNNEDGE